MEDLGAVSDDQVILAWLQAEIESPPFQSYLIGDPECRLDDAGARDAQGCRGRLERREDIRGR
jgi:hypothetical protein